MPTPEEERAAAIAAIIEKALGGAAAAPDEPATDKRISTRTIGGVTYILYERPDGSNYVQNTQTLERTDGGFPAVQPAAPKLVATTGGSAAPAAAKPSQGAV